MKILLLGNWGIGLEILKALHNSIMVGPIIVVARFSEESRDPWENALYLHAKKLGYETFREQETGFDRIKSLIHGYGIDLMITHAFMKILPPDIFSAPRLGTLNIHPSLLPKYRGPSPTEWAVRNRETETGLTSHYVDRGMDTGDIVFQVKTDIMPDDTVSTVIEKEKVLVPLLVEKSLALILDPSFVPLQQDDAAATYAPKVEKGGARV